ncbi:hypothetical protein AMTRI_Chr10g226640 [Amborella trichopoda]
MLKAAQAQPNYQEKKSVCIMAEPDQHRPLAPATAGRSSSDEEGAASRSQSPAKRKRRGLYCCGACTLILLMLVAVGLALAFTVFKVKEPKINMESIAITNLNTNTNTNLLLTGQVALNMTVRVGISVKNPNAASFKFQNSTTLVSYRNVTMGEAFLPAGKAPAGRTFRANVTMVVLADRLLGDQNLVRDLLSGVLKVSSYTLVKGRVNVWNIVKRHADVEMSCDIDISISDMAVRDQNCKHSVKL